MKKGILIIALLFSVQMFSQAIYEDERYVPETDPAVLKNLEAWQGKKFGLLMHWGTYSQWGIVESWSICPEDYGWFERKKGSNPANYNQYVADYEGLKKTFNPTKFDPVKWAKAAKAAGMKYMVFTTKHHDGFNMYDTKYSDYKVTDAACPFSTNPKADILKEVFNAFRAENISTGAYFSKPDWHNENYWDPYFPPFDRNVNYDPSLYPEKWQKYVDFTHNQILEILTNYGKVDILWLDGGWVRKRDQQNLKENYDEKFAENESKNGFIKHRVVDQDPKMDELVVKARQKQPGLIVVDRAVHGKNQNYLTPEGRVPAKTLPYPWESCITSGGGWSYSPDATYMTGRQGIHMLVDIVAKGGNLLLNVAPSPEGEWQQGAYDLLQAYADWMKVNSTAIYETKPIEPYKEENICFTQNKAGNVFAFYLAKEGEDKIPAEVTVKSISPKKGTKITMLGSKTSLKWTKEGNGFKVVIPESLRNNLPAKEAWTLKIEAINR